MKSQQIVGIALIGGVAVWLLYRRSLLPSTPIGVPIGSTASIPPQIVGLPNVSPSIAQDVWQQVTGQVAGEAQQIVYDTAQPDPILVAPVDTTTPLLAATFLPNPTILM